MGTQVTADYGNMLYRKIWEDYDDDWGASVVGIIGGQGSVKTSACLDLAEKKMDTHPQEKIFWHETVGSPCQFLKLQRHPYKIFIEQDTSLDFVNTNTGQLIKPQIHRFDTIDELYNMADTQTLNVVFFGNKKSWTCFNPEDKTDDQGLLEYCMTNENAAESWQTIFMDEMESIFPADCNNQTKELWWNWVHNSTEKIKECRKSRVGLIGNYHNHGSIFHEIRNKFMFHMWGFGSQPRHTRVKQWCVDQLKMGEFWIDHQGTVFGKIRIGTVYKPPFERWTVRYSNF